jgi:hypothetical protein
MLLTNLMAEIQANPRNVVYYRKLAQYFREHDMEYIYEAFRSLIEQKFNDSAYIDEE